MPHQVTDIIVPIWNFIKYFFRSLWTLIKFRAQEFDNKLKAKYSTTKRAFIWLAIVSGTLIVILVTLSVLSDFGFKAINLNGPRPQPPTPTITPLP